MSALRRSVAASVVGVLLSVTAVVAAEQVGEAVVIKTAVTGDAGPLAVKSPIHRNERIKTSGSGLGQFIDKTGRSYGLNEANSESKCNDRMSGERG